MTTTDRQAGTRLLRRLRERRGWSWADLARALRDTARQLAMTSLSDRPPASIRRAIARWESDAERTSPGDRYQVLLAHLYARTAAGELALGPGTDFDTFLEALRYLGTAPQRLQQLIELVTPSPHHADGRSPARLTIEAIRGMHDSVAEITRQVGSIPFVRLQLQLAPIVDTCRQRLRLDSTDAHDELLRLATNAYALAARLAFETHDDETAMALYNHATSAAGRRGDHSHQAAVQTSHTMVTLHATNDLEAARTIARAGTINAHRGPSHAIRARAHAVHAEICARAGQAGEAATALDRAWKTLEQRSADDPHGGFNTERLSGFDGLCALHAGNARHAQTSLEQSAAALHTSRDAVQHGIVTTDLALARLRLGDPAACVDLLHDAVDITAATGGRVARQRIRLTRRELRPWRTEDFLAELDDHIHETLIGR